MYRSCPGLMRIAGTAAYIVVSCGVFAFGNWCFHFGFTLRQVTIGDLSASGKTLVVVSGLCGIVGAIVGQAIGATIPVVNDRVCRLINLIWQGMANGSIAWCGVVVVGIAMTKSRAEALEYMRSVDQFRFALLSVALGSLAGWLMLAWNWRIGLLFARSSSPVFTWLGLAGIGAGLAYAHALMLGFSPTCMVLAGACAPLLVMPLSIAFYNRDEDMRKVGPARLRSGGRVSCCCDTCGRRLIKLAVGHGYVSLTDSETIAQIGAAEECRECGRFYCDKCYPSRPQNRCVCGKGRTSVHREGNTIFKGSMRLVRVRYLDQNNP